MLHTIFQKKKIMRLPTCQHPQLSAAWRSGSERRFYDDHDRKVNGSTPNLVSLLRPWIRCFTMIISAWWNLVSSKLKKSEENSTGKQRQLLSESGFVLRIAPPSLSRDRRIKMKKSETKIVSQLGRDENITTKFTLLWTRFFANMMSEMNSLTSKTPCS